MKKRGRPVIGQPKSNRIEFRTDDDTMNNIKRGSTNLGISMADFFRQALDEYCSKLKEQGRM